MSKNIVTTEKRGRGRPPKEEAILTVVTIALYAATAERFSQWMEENDIRSRSEAGRRLIEAGLDAVLKPVERRRGGAAK
jgi:hypothetical protein